MAAIAEEATLQNQGWSARFADMDNDYERAMWGVPEQATAFRGGPRVL